MRSHQINETLGWNTDDLEYGGWGYATYYYWLWSLAHSMHRVKAGVIDTPAGKAHWAEAIAGELLQRQREDGSWANTFTDGKEDDPLVSTPLAAAALAICRQVLSREQAIGR